MSINEKLVALTIGENLLSKNGGILSNQAEIISARLERWNADPEECIKEEVDALIADTHRLLQEIQESLTKTTLALNSFTKPSLRCRGGGG